MSDKDEAAWLSISEISHIRMAVDGGMKHDLEGFGKFVAAKFTSLQGEVDELRAMLKECITKEQDGFSSGGAIWFDNWVLRARALLEKTP